MSFAPKKSYKKPQLTTYGDVEKLTLHGQMTNSDSQGVNSALPNPV